MNSIAQITFTALQVYLFFIYAKIRINKYFWIQVLSKFGMMLLFGINLSVWLSTLVEEAREEIAGHEEHDAQLPQGTTTASHHFAANDVVQNSSYSTNGHTLTPSYKCSDGIQNAFSPYLFPCVIEHSLLSASMVYIIWTKVGEKVQMRRTTYIEDGNIDASEEKDENHVGTPKTDFLGRVEVGNRHHNGYFTYHFGTYLGFLLLCFILVVIMMFLHNAGQEKHSNWLFELHRWHSTVTLFVADFLFNILSIVTSIFTYIKMSPLAKKNTFLKEARHRRERRMFAEENRHQFKMLDKALMGVSYMGVLGYTILTFIAGIFGDTENDSLRTLVMVSICIDIISTTMQTVFLVAFALPRRSITREHAIEKPGRQGLIFLQFINFCLWALDTFALRSADPNTLQQNFYSFTAWAILSTLTFPLVIWFRFHSVVVLADVVKHSYTDKYVGLKTTKKRR
ncbi:otopetrin-2-like [Lingula anatina]|uniref:Otopetrin-2-like n=1 Tax=Lingula anatina TaxID=7574 RepID=A0A1S3HPK2_LINAN|nr:otopetrin-2-like [Lingula anatina]|eukprot:XP_013386964.1 otopetrin-2-like [Lingula anatina]